jgi:hypothetical protein
LLLTGVLIAGLGGGVAAAFGLSRLNSSFSTAAQLERASGMSVIGSIGEVMTAGQNALRRRRLQMFAAAMGGLAFAWIALLGLEMFQRGMVA